MHTVVEGQVGHPTSYIGRDPSQQGRGFTIHLQVVLSINSPFGHTIDTGQIGHVPADVVVGAVGFDPSQHGGASCTHLQSILFKNSPIGQSINAGQDGHPPV